MASGSQVADMDKMGMEVAYAKAKKSYDEGGVPIGAALVHCGKGNGGEPSVVGAGHNERIQKQSPILHGETSALEDAGRLKPNVYRNSTMVSRQNYGNCEVPSLVLNLTKFPDNVVHDS